MTIDASQGPAAVRTRSEPYPPAPWELFGQAQVHLLALPAARLQRVPDGFAPLLLGGSALVAAGFIDYQRSSMVRYGELFAAVVGRIEGTGRVTSTVTHMWVDSDVSRRGGRELWGYPKELASLRLAIDPGGSASAADTAGQIASAQMRPLLVSPLRISFNGGTAQPLHGALRPVRARMRGRPVIGAGSFAADRDGPLGFLTDARHIIAFGLRDFHFTFG
ncbi:MAG TPA: acetoacetate decarboxylase family protein [Solirubrobacteraceae bacterium]|nr:acetoacetate decarboxylase family protein [Solirubrobacteraceae bacterium]